MLHIHRGERADGLVGALGDVLVAPLDDPLSPEVIAVPTRGVERWLGQSLAARLGVTAGQADGVCANIEFPFPASLVGAAVAAAIGIDRDTDPWLPERSVWPLLDVVDGCLTEPWLSALAGHLGPSGSDDDAQRRARRFASVRHIADLYDRYSVHRPQMLRAWASGDDADGAGDDLSPTAKWQAELWRRLRGRLPVASPAERLPVACEALSANGTLVDLPSRVSLFGITRLPVSYLEVLSALAATRDVHLFVLHPSPELWKRVAEATAPGPRIVRRRGDRTAVLPRNPLLASWGQDTREMQLVLSSLEGAQGDDHRPVTEQPATLLQRIQADVRSDRAPSGAPLSAGGSDARPTLDSGDRSLQIHSCHGLARQVEVVRDAILHLLAGDPTLEARDVIVMCPDIETFAPLIHATFGAGAGTEPQLEPFATAPSPSDAIDLRVRLADRALRQTNPVLGVIGELLDLASARLTAASVLDLAGREPVRRRFGFDDDDLARLEDWVSATGVRWGLDADHRAPFQLQWLEANTWRAGLDRILLGVALAEAPGPSGGLAREPLVGGVLPLDDVGSGDIDLAGRLAEFLDRLGTVLDRLNQPKAVTVWARDLAMAADALTDTGSHDAWQRLQLQGLLDDVVTEATVGGIPNRADLTLAEVRALLSDRLKGRPTRANFRTGHLTICTLVPMRSVPHRVVCLLGLDDGVFPRKTARDGDDITLSDPYVGDRDGRAEDRQLLLDALLAATDTLVITYCGRDERTNAERPPAVPVGELLEVIDRTVQLSGSAPAREHVVVHHPLQPFDVRNFTPGVFLPRSAWSFDRVSLDGACALSGTRVTPPPFLTGPLPSAPNDIVELDQLVRFVQHPVRAFLRQRLNLSLSDRYGELGDAVPVELDPLEQWEIGQRLVEARLAGGDRQATLDAEMARGILPPGALAEPILDRLGPMVDDVVAAAVGMNPHGFADSASREVNLSLPGGRLLVGTVAGLNSSLVTNVNFSRLGAKHRLATWVRFLALSAACPDVCFEGVTVGRRRDGAPVKRRVSVSRIAALGGDPAKRRGVALGHLAVLVDLFDRGMREPLPLYCNTSAAYVAAMAAGKDPHPAARKAWQSEHDFPREDADLEHQLVLGGQVAFDDLLNELPRHDESGEGWAASESSRFGRYSLRLWDGLLSCEELAES